MIKKIAEWLINTEAFRTVVLDSLVNALSVAVVEMSPKNTYLLFLSGMSDAEFEALVIAWERRYSGLPNQPPLVLVNAEVSKMMEIK